MRSTKVCIRCVSSAALIQPDNSRFVMIIKSLGCRWSNNKKLWYWHHPEEGVKWHKRKTTMSEIRSKYGSETISSNRNTRLEAVV